MTARRRICIRRLWPRTQERAAHFIVRLLRARDYETASQTNRNQRYE
jgi:hypothetical protein